MGQKYQVKGSGIKSTIRLLTYGIERLNRIVSDFLPVDINVAHAFSRLQTHEP